MHLDPICSLCRWLTTCDKYIILVSGICFIVSNALNFMLLYQKCPYYKWNKHLMTSIFYCKAGIFYLFVYPKRKSVKGNGIKNARWHITWKPLSINRPCTTTEARQFLNFHGKISDSLNSTCTLRLAVLVTMFKGSAEALSRLTTHSSSFQFILSRQTWEGMSSYYSSFFYCYYYSVLLWHYKEEVSARRTVLQARQYSPPRTNAKALAKQWYVYKKKTSGATVMRPNERA